uniref:CASC1 C-terminal domain-containing protein n=1 Tax=Glossina brevipalpis TaxID=37001 RepID=A0A1A9WF87_9MUSC
MANGRKRKSRGELKKSNSIEHQEMKEYYIISPEEKKGRDLRHSHCIMELQTCAHFINEAVKNVERQKEKQRLLDKWNGYVNCDPIPEPNIPADVHTKMSKLQILEELNLGMNWMLLADERSILSQNIFREFRTRKELLASTENEFATQCVQTIDIYLDLLQRVERFCIDGKQRSKVSKEALDNIELLKEKLQNEIRDLLNRYTYRVLSTGLCYKISLDSLSWEHTLVTNNFEMHIWGLQNVPIRWTHLPEPRMLVDFHQLNVILHVPYSMLRDGLTIQALHTNFDHVSEKVKGIDANNQKPTEILSSCIKELPECLQKELYLQNEIQEEVRKQIVSNYQEYEKKKEEYLIAHSQKTKGNKKEKKVKGIKMRKPQKINDDEYPEIFEIFLEKESRQHKDFIDNIYNAQIRHLTYDEINLKRFTILGGIYEVNFVQSPSLADFTSFNMIWHIDKQNIILDNEAARIHKYSRSTHYSRNQSIVDVRESRVSLLNPNLEALRETIDPENPFFVLIFQLPEHLCYWSEPVVCQYEVIEKIVTIENNSNVFKDAHLVDSLTQEIRANAEQARHYSKDDTCPFQFATADKHEIVEDCYVDDFSLVSHLSTKELRKIERFCIPQMLSSFKFNKEIQEDAQKKRKRRNLNARLLRRSRGYSFNKKLFRIFQYDEAQNNPERLFTIFGKGETLKFLNRLERFSETSSSAPATFYQLFKRLKLIKEMYQSKINKILQLPEFAPKTEVLQKIKKDKKDTRQPLLKSKRSSANLKRLAKQRSRQSISSAHPSLGSFSKYLIHQRESTGKNIENESSEHEMTKTITCAHWTTQHVRSSCFIKEECKMIIETDRLGIFGFAFDRYEHFPFKYWELKPSEGNPKNEVVFTLETQYVRCTLYITSEGICGEMTEPSTNHIKNPKKKYLIIDKPINDYVKFRNLLKERHINIFPDQEAYHYIDNGHYSPKHLATEMHTYCCMALHCTQVAFKRSIYNRIAKRRDIILEYTHLADKTLNNLEIHITPGGATFVQVSEICSEDMTELVLAYNLTWRNVGVYCDLHQTICSVHAGSMESRCRNDKLIYFVKSLLGDVKPLSFS